ncbi:MAG: hypothetical protein KDD62_01810 [Bdellovibrionales bacterium]|nr:hypothetical protein [Bdellovibrionales bacterium]
MTEESMTGVSVLSSWNLQSNSNRADNEKQSYLNERSFGKTARQHVKEFGGLFGLISLIVFAWALSKHMGSVWLASSAVSASFFLGTAYLLPTALYPLWKGWMKLAHMMSLVMTFFILSICWMLMLVPMASILRLIGKEVMDSTFDRSLETYWVDRSAEKHDFLLLEKQY